MSNGKYKVNWEDNVKFLKPLLKDVTNSFDTEVEPLHAAFIIPHDIWVDAGFSGSSTPDFIFLDHTNDILMSTTLENISLLESEVLTLEKALPLHTHYCVTISKNPASLCGLNSTNLSSKLADVTCPCCMLEIFERENVIHNTINGKTPTITNKNEQPIALVTNLVSKWKDIIETNEDVLIFSPYITDILLDVLVENAHNIKAIYTKFSLKDFIAGASNLDVIETLLNNNISVYYSNNLHAKIFITKENMTIGSQNCTFGSEHNFELSIVSQDEQIIEQTYLNTTKCRSSSKKINQLMIDIMRSFMGRAEPEYESWLDKVNKLEDKLFDLFSIDTECIPSSIEENINNLTRTDSIKCRFGDTSGEYGHIKTSIIPVDPEQSLLEWTLDDETFSLTRLHRYLLIDQISGHLGWARIGKTRITFINNTLRLSKRIFLADVEYSVTVEARKYYYIKKNNQNITILLTSKNNNFNLKVGGFLNLDEIVNVSIIQVLPKYISELMNKLLKLHMNDILRLVLNEIGAPFVYSKSNASGTCPNIYFDNVPQHHLLNVAISNGEPFLFIDY
jgi:hypothetical protein